MLRLQGRDQVGIVALLQARLEQLVRNLLLAAGSNSWVQVTDINDAHD